MSAPYMGVYQYSAVGRVSVQDHCFPSTCAPARLDKTASIPGFQKAHEFKKFTSKTLSHCYVRGKQQANWTNATYNEQ